jgi:S-ribosylhomocysteine lyase LuxS involved in autoinducer biosynthesis
MKSKELIFNRWVLSYIKLRFSRSTNSFPILIEEKPKAKSIFPLDKKFNQPNKNKVKLIYIHSQGHFIDKIRQECCTIK